MWACGRASKARATSRRTMPTQTGQRGAMEHKEEMKRDGKWVKKVRLMFNHLRVNFKKFRIQYFVFKPLVFV